MDSDLSQADSRLSVKFYQKEIDNEFETIKQNRPIKMMRDFVEIRVPGDQLTIIDTFAQDEHKKRFPIQWARYQNEKNERGESGDAVQGTLLKDWALLSPSQASELKHFNFFTVEQIANASDAQISTIGMAVGMSPLAFREKAKVFLSSAKDGAYVQQQADELRKRDAEIEALKQQMQEMMASLNQQPKRGRPAKEVGEEATE